MEALVVGYGDGPKVYAILDKRRAGELPYCVLGNQQGSMDYLVKNVSKNHWENAPKTGNKIAVKMLGKASKANPSEIGKPYLIWHMSPSGVRELESSEIDKLDKKYNGS